MTPMQWLAVWMIIASCGVSRECRGLGVVMMIFWGVVIASTWVVERLAY